MRRRERTKSRKRREFKVVHEAGPASNLDWQKKLRGGEEENPKKKGRDFQEEGDKHSSKAQSPARSSNV